MHNWEVVGGFPTHPPSLRPSESVTPRPETRKAGALLKHIGSMSPSDVDALFPDAPCKLDQNVSCLTALSTRSRTGVSHASRDRPRELYQRCEPYSQRELQR
jgi:hypothetical protein